MFRIFDINNCGTISKKEVTRIVQVLYDYQVSEKEELEVNPHKSGAIGKTHLHSSDIGAFCWFVSTLIRTCLSSASSGRVETLFMLSVELVNADKS